MPQTSSRGSLDIPHISRELTRQFRRLGKEVEERLLRLKPHIERSLVLLDSSPPFCRGVGKGRRGGHRVLHDEFEPTREARIGDEKTGCGVVGDAFAVGLSEEIVRHGHADDAAELVLGDVGGFCELGDSDGFVWRDEREDAEVG